MRICEQLRVKHQQASCKPRRKAGKKPLGWQEGDKEYFITHCCENGRGCRYTAASGNGVNPVNVSSHKPPKYQKAIVEMSDGTKHEIRLPMEK